MDGRRRAPKQPLDCHERALRLLAVRPRSRRELTQRLERAGFDPDEVASEIARLTVVGLVDDEAFARQVAEHQVVQRRAGRRAVIGALAAKGIDRATIEDTLSGLPADEAARADELAVSRAERLRGIPPQKAYARLVAFLARRGYEPSIASAAARRALRVEDTDA